MKKMSYRILSMLLILVLVVSSLVVPSFAAESSDLQYNYSKEYNSGKRNEVCTTLNGTSADDYYKGSYTYERLSELSADSLKSGLHTLMAETHTRITTYSDCRDYAIRTDCENEANYGVTNPDEQTLVLLYTSYTATRSQYNGWNREHVWPQSLGGKEISDSMGEKKGGADLHHVRPSDAGVNSSRGNKPYNNTNRSGVKYGSNPAVNVLGGYYDSTYFEPLDNVKGDIARICLYVWIRWGSEWGADNITELFPDTDVLLEWCELDPVDTWEMGRNEVVEDIQGNRNVFIDYPEYAWLILGKEIPMDMVTPSGEAMATLPPCTHINVILKNAVAATCTVDGYDGDTYCADCDTLLSSGNKINAKGHGPYRVENKTTPTCTDGGYSGDTFCTVCNRQTVKGTALSALGHGWSEWVENTEATMKTHTCERCGVSESVPIETPECTHTNTELKNFKDAECAAQGYTGDTYCTDCGAKLSSGSLIPATENHTWGEPVVKVEPTPDKPGEAVRTCTVCGGTKSETLIYVPVPPTPDTKPSVWGESYKTNEEKIVAIISKNALYSLVISLLTR